MKSDLEKALEAVDEKLEEALPDIIKNHRKAAKNATPEPDVLRSGTFDEIGLRRSIKEQEDEKLP